MAKRVILISGLGANEKAFSKIGKLPYHKIFVKWLPSNSNDSLEDYAKRLISYYEISGEDVLVGLSFGGLLCQCIASMLKNRIVILLSSFRTSNDLNPFFKFSLKMGLHKLMPTMRVPLIDLVVARILNGGNNESTPVLYAMLKDTDYKLMKWSLQAIADSKTYSLPKSKVFSFIGNKDFIVSQWGGENVKYLNGGSHFMVFDKGRFITKEINEILNQNG